MRLETIRFRFRRARARHSGRWAAGRLFPPSSLCAAAHRRGPCRWAGTLPMNFTAALSTPSVLVKVPSTPSITGCSCRYRSSACATAPGRRARRRRPVRPNTRRCLPSENPPGAHRAAGSPDLHRSGRGSGLRFRRRWSLHRHGFGISERLGDVGRQRAAEQDGEESAKSVRNATHS